MVTYFHYLRLRELANPEYFSKFALGISFERQVAEERKEKEWWLELDKNLIGLEVMKKGGILDYPEPALRVDFANCYIGGGVLEDGNVQEELYFATHPELYLSILFCPPMEANEAILCIGAERVSVYTGYGYSASFEAAHEDKRYGDLHGRLDHQMVAIDARPYIWDKREQYAEAEMVRELNKALVGFTGESEERQSPPSIGLRPIVSGNWGCGMFNGDPQLKSLLQWLSATAADRRLVYSVHNDRRMGSFSEIVEKYRGGKAKDLARDLWEIVGKYRGELGDRRTVFELLLQSPEDRPAPAQEAFELQPLRLAKKH